jgi:hypothetical protein
LVFLLSDPLNKSTNVETLKKDATYLQVERWGKIPGAPSATAAAARGVLAWLGISAEVREPMFALSEATSKSTSEAWRLFGIHKAGDSFSVLSSDGVHELSNDWLLTKLTFTKLDKAPSFPEVVAASRTISKLSPRYSVLFMCYWCVARWP